MGASGEREVYKSKQIITATEWLNRHDIFVFGQEVLVAGFTQPASWKTRRYIQGTVCVLEGSERSFDDGDPFSTHSWSKIKSPFTEWKDQPELVEIVVKGKKFMVSEDYASCLSNSLSLFKAFEKEGVL